MGRKREKGTIVSRRNFVKSGAAAGIAGAASGGLVSMEGEAQEAQSRDDVRVGIIGAGSIARRIQIPSFRQIPGCEVVAVANRSLESSRRVTDAFNIPRPYAHWKELLEDESIDAVLIGTPPYMHRTLTLAALEKGKHVLCQSRMSSNAQEARDMVEGSQRYPELVCQLVATSFSYKIDNVLKRLIGDGFLGEVLSVDLQRIGTDFADFDGELSIRQDHEANGLNIPSLGSTYESMNRWLGRGNRVMAMSKVHVPYRRRFDGELTSVSIPDHVDILYELVNGAQVHIKLSRTTGLSRGLQIWIYGTEGTIYVNDQQDVFAGSRGDSQLREVPNPPEEQAYRRVEQEFINAIRGIEEVKMDTFEIGLYYMEFTEAVHDSCHTGQAVYLPWAIALT